MSADVIRVSGEWLDLREPADAAARAAGLVTALERHLPTTGPRVIHDLGGGTGAMGRWLAPRLSGRQHWVIHDRDRDLLVSAAANPPGAAADGSAVTLETRQSDITRLPAGELAQASLITASALLDLLTRDELAALVSAAGAAGRPMLLTLSVVGQVQMTPEDPLDGRLGAAFDAHQRRMTARGRLLGPDAVPVAVEALRRLGSDVRVVASPWRLGPPQAELTAAWLAGWVQAAGEQERALAGEIGGYTRRRLAQARAGRLAVTVGHADLLALPRAVVNCGDQLV